MKRIKVIITVSVLVCMGAAIILACKKSFLNQKNTFGLPADAVATTKDNVIEAVNSIYDTYQNSDLLKMYLVQGKLRHARFL